MYDDEYFRRYTELSELITRAYADYYILNAIKIYRKRAVEEQYLLNGAFIVAHWCTLTVEDLGLTIWKITDKNETKSNTIITLKNYLIKTHKKDIKPSLNKSQDKIRNELSTIRKQFLAHNDIVKAGVDIPVNDLYEVLEDVKQYFDVLCCPDIDSRVSAFQRPDGLHITEGVQTLLENNSIKKETD